MMILTLAILSALMQAAPAELVPPTVEKPPQIDGTASDACWKGAPELSIPLVDVETGMERVTVKIRAVRTADEIFFLVQWADETRDVRHKPFLWNKATQAYEESELEEDVLSLAFELEGPFDYNMLSGKESKWDVWQWKAGRTNPAGYAMDKWHHYSRSQVKKGRKFFASDGKPMWMGRYEDDGTSATLKAAMPAAHQGDEVAQYVPQKPSGSAADVRAKGVWSEKQWTVELARKLKTGTADDTQFEVGRSCGMAVAVFDRTEHSNHWVAPEFALTLKSR